MLIIKLAAGSKSNDLNLTLRITFELLNRGTVWIIKTISVSVIGIKKKRKIVWILMRLDPKKKILLIKRLEIRPKASVSLNTYI